ncbi:MULTISPECIES: hypothetical protein [Chitinophagaceae]
MFEGNKKTCVYLGDATKSLRASVASVRRPCEYEALWDFVHLAVLQKQNLRKAAEPLGASVTNDPASIGQTSGQPNF